MPTEARVSVPADKGTDTLVVLVPEGAHMDGDQPWVPVRGIHGVVHLHVVGPDSETAEIDRFLDQCLVIQPLDYDKEWKLNRSQIGRAWRAWAKARNMGAAAGRVVQVYRAVAARHGPVTKIWPGFWGWRRLKIVYEIDARTARKRGM